MSANIQRAMINGERAWWEGMNGKHAVNLNRLATAAEAIKAGGLDWEALRIALYRDGATEDEVVQIPNFFGIQRSDTKDILGVVGSSFRPLQNRDAFKFFDEIVGEGKAIYETAGCLGRGEKVWLLARLPGEIRVGKDDVAKKFILLANGHANNFMVRHGLTAVRVVCQNTLLAAIADEGMTAMRHTGDMAAKVTEAGKLYQAAWRSFEKVEETFNRLLKQPISEASAKMFTSILYKQAAQAAAERAAKQESGETVIDAIAELREVGKGADLPGVRGSLWGAYNAVTEYEDYHRGAREGTDRLGRALMGSGASIKRQALSLAEEVLEDGEAILKPMLDRIVKVKAPVQIGDELGGLLDKPTTIGK